MDSDKQAIVSLFMVYNQVVIWTEESRCKLSENLTYAACYYRKLQLMRRRLNHATTLAGVASHQPALLGIKTFIF